MTVSVVRQVSPFVTTLGQRLGPVLAFKAHIRSNWGIFEVENPYICGDTSSFLTLLLSTLLLSLKFSLKVFLSFQDFVGVSVRIERSFLTGTPCLAILFLLIFMFGASG